MSTTHKAALIRAELKKKYGWNSRQVSVRARYYSLGSSIDIMINDPTVEIHKVDEIAKQHESVRYCEYSGEILSGGNTYVHVGYSREALAVRASNYISKIADALEERDRSKTGNTLIPVAGTKYLVGRDQFDRPTLWNDSFICMGNSAKDLAERIACLKGA